ncbi:MAG: GuaB3 family IMP dehydrogenase-related protein [Armatimonadota bacterium]|nr:GuaB3 family IMP dehydrogenase-related protein [Armatimonadota bacterium]
MEVDVGGKKKARRAYGFDEVAVVPSTTSVDVADTDTGWYIRDMCFPIPILASAMDGAVDPRLAAEMTRLGGLAALNLEGVHSRYENPQAAIDKIISADPEGVIPIIQKIYQEPVKAELAARTVKTMKAAGAKVAVSATPVVARQLAKSVFDAGADIFVIQSTVTAVEYISSTTSGVSISDFCRNSPIPVIVGNSVDYNSTIALMRAGAAAVLVGVGPGAACTTRKVCGIGVPQVTATADAAAARDDFEAETGKYVPIITDGGMRTGGDIVKAIVSGADAVMIGSPIAGAAEAPGKGYHWGMSTFHPGLPRGTRIKVGISGSLEEILFGPAKTDNGTMNLIGALKLAMSYCGSRTIRDLQKAELIIAPALPMEGKTQQRAQGVGQWR